MNGAKVIARAWTDPEYRTRLLADGTAAIAELGFGGPEGEHMVVVENTADVHNLVVCTLCSCYPWPILGLPPKLVQGARLPFTCSAGTAHAARRDGHRDRRRRRGPGVGFQCRGTLSGAADASGGH